MTRLLTAALLLAAGLAAAQPGQVGKPGPSIREDKRTVRQENAAQRAQLAGLNAQEKKAMGAVTADTTLSKSASNAEKRRIHAGFKAKKDAIRSQMRIERRRAALSSRPVEAPKSR
ncbi:MAG TPA: hypothetical protein VH309_08690 [Elusimicrobiota bacterium]|jgi:hypothetical protein|nr:hypothetical protein [Elusimicrobiota bacterium]